jgi:ubiquinone/menaquinone biosynthesis C-methylase UbiE
MDKKTSYDKIAKQYDFLSRLVFVKSQIKAQTDQLHYLVNCNSLLIVGGGTGWILKDLNTLARPIKIVFVEMSIAMITLAKKVETHHQIEFVHDDIEMYKTEAVFDAVLTPFLFDNFDLAKAEKVFSNIDKLLVKNGLWLFVDFYVDERAALWKKAILKTMHLFFKWINVVHVAELIDVSPFFNSNYSVIKEDFYYGKFIKAVVYRKK